MALPDTTVVPFNQEYNGGGEPPVDEHVSIVLTLISDVGIGVTVRFSAQAARTH